MHMAKRIVKKYGILRVLRKGLSVEDAQQLGVVLKTNRSIDTIIMEKCDISCEAVR